MSVTDWWEAPLVFYISQFQTPAEVLLCIPSSKNPRNERLSLFGVKGQYNGYMILKNVLIE